MHEKWKSIERRTIEIRRLITDRRANNSGNFIELKDITSDFIKWDNIQQVERRDGIYRRIVKDRRNGGKYVRLETKIIFQD